MSDKKEKNGKSKNLRVETWRGVVSMLFFVVGIILVLASLGLSGIAGSDLYGWLKYLFGLGYFLIPAVCIILGFSFWKAVAYRPPLARILGLVLFFVSGLGITDVVFAHQGGIIGRLVSTPLISFFDVYVATILLDTSFVISLLIIFDAELPLDALAVLIRRFFSFSGKHTPIKVARETEYSEETPKEITDDAETPPDRESAPEPRADKKPATAPPREEFEVKQKTGGALLANLTRPYEPPPLSLLEHDKGKPVVGDIKANANIIKRTLQNFGINVEMDEVAIGPSVTRYALKPAEGVKLSRIVALQNDLALALAAHPIRIEAPIPGKSLVGIEIPNTIKSMVGLANLIEHAEYTSSDKSLLVGLGKGVSGKLHFSNLAKMPHLLIAGATGSGKSVTIHTLISSLLFRNSPESLKFIMIDPKRVELTLYNKIPHLLTPVITDAKKAILSLKWAAKEMDRRYDILESEAVRDIESYHKNVLAPELKKLAAAKKGDELQKSLEVMPYIVIVIDELADIMTTYPRELEAGIVRLAQMSRAVGIHLILSTQRPSVNVITGLIKANIPARIALQVSSQIDSRTILDTGGAEKLLGAGDMLFLSGEMSKPQRIQSAFISETEVKKVAKYFADHYKDEVPSEIAFTPEAIADKNSIFDAQISDDEEIDDDLYEQAREEVTKAGKASTSYIQRKLRVGYARAARLMDVLEERGVIGPADGSKPREVIGAGPTANTTPVGTENVE